MSKDPRKENGDSTMEETNHETEQPNLAPETAEASGGEVLQNELLYLRAEFDNYRKRVRKEQEQAIKFANEKLIGELVGVLDFFDRALASSQPLKDRKMAK